ncbi:MAG: hypothetical protein ACOC0D_02175 [Spirochaeta sp.]
MYYYLTVYPIEALIASQLSPEDFGTYMATGTKKSKFEPIMFFEVDGGFGSYFDWQYAAERCVAHPDGGPKHTLYLSAYRTLENTPLSRLKDLYLTTRDGRSLQLSQTPMPRHSDRSFHLYQELCPVQPLVVSTLDPVDFASFMTDPEKTRISVPAIVFTDVKMVDLSSDGPTGNVGPAYDRNSDHLHDCIREVKELSGKPTKTVYRTNIERFSFQVISSGIFAGNRSEETVFFPMPDLNTLHNEHYDWARSAQLL